MSRTVRQWIQSILQRAKPNQATPVPYSGNRGDSMSLGRDAHGVCFSLNLRTGQIESTAPTPPVSARIVPFGRINQEWLLEVLPLGGYRVWIDDDIVMVRTDLGTVTVQINTDAELICFCCTFPFDQAALSSDRDALVVSLNELTYFVRFQVGTGESLFAEYELTTSVGISSAQLLAAFRAFAGHAGSVLALCNAEDLLQ